MTGNEETQDNNSKKDGKEEVHMHKHWLLHRKESTLADDNPDSDPQTLS